MRRRSIAKYTKAEFDVLRNRLENARDALRSSGCLLQSVARAYYIVYATASFGAGKHGVTARHFRGREQVVDQDFSHNELPDVIYALYTGGKRANIDDPGSGPGIGSGNYTEREAWVHADTLYRMRLQADYGPTETVEPHTPAEADSLLTIAKNLTQDLERLL